MKRFGNLWEGVMNEDEAVEAIRDAIVFKKKHKEVQRLLLKDVPEGHPEWHQIDLDKTRAYARQCLEELRDFSWQHKPPKHRRAWCANKTHGKGKWRDLYVPTLKDHCIAHILMRACEKAFTKGMHPHCCGSVPKRGIRHLYKNVRKWLKYDGKSRYFVKLDVRKFFDNITKEQLMECFERRIKDERILWGLRQIVYSAPVACPVGYYTSPWFSNLLLQDLDWFVEQDLWKERRGRRIKYVRHYLRYVDDLLLVGSSRSDPEKSVRAIKKYLAEKYDLEVKNNWEVKKVGTYRECRSAKSDARFLDMGGYKFSRDAVILRDGIYLGTTRLARRIRKRHKPTLGQMLSITSRVGWAKMCNHFRFLKLKINPFVSVRKIRRKISHVEKIGKRGLREAA